MSYTCSNCGMPHHGRMCYNPYNPYCDAPDKQPFELQAAAVPFSNQGGKDGVCAIDKSEMENRFAMLSVTRGNETVILDLTEVEIWALRDLLVATLPETRSTAARSDEDDRK